jgi:hypothetical protein
MVDKLAYKRASYLFNKNGIFHFSRRVPLELKHHYKSSRISFSLKTKDPKIAASRSKELATRLDGYWFHLRMQEDQIYHLQDQLLSKSARLERTAGENASLRRQLGIGDGGSSSPGRGSSAPTFVPPPPLPKVSVPGLTAPGGTGAAPSS